MNRCDTAQLRYRTGVPRTRGDEPRHLRRFPPGRTRRRLGLAETGARAGHALRRVEGCGSSNARGRLGPGQAVASRDDFPHQRPVELLGWALGAAERSRCAPGPALLDVRRSGGNAVVFRQRYLKVYQGTRNRQVLFVTEFHRGVLEGITFFETKTTGYFQSMRGGFLRYALVN